MLSDTPRIRSRLDLLYLVTREFNVGLDIEEVLHRVLAVTVAAVGAYDASLFLFDTQGDLENYFLIHDFKLEKRSLGTMKRIHDQGLVGWVKEHLEGVLIRDISQDERWFKDENNPELHPAGCAMAIPIQLPEQLIGVLTITATQRDYFENSDLAVLTIIADQAAFAIANARLFQAEQHRRRLADTLASVTQTLNSTLNLNEVLNLILEQLALVIEYDSSSIFLMEEDETLRVRAARGFENIADALQVVVPIHQETPNHQTIALKKPVYIPDVAQDPTWIKNPSSQHIRSWIGAPLIARNKVIGMLTVDSREVNKYTEENVWEVAAFAGQAATAVANAQIVTSLKNVEASYTALFEDSTDLIVITNYQGLILNVNRTACQMLRRPKDALIDSDIIFIDRQFRTALEQQSPRLRIWKEVSFELEVLDAYRQVMALEVKARQVHYNGQDCVQWVGRDISARKEFEKMRQDMVNMLVHDLRGPLGNMINTMELLPMLLGSTDDNPNLAHILRMARRSGQEVRDLVDSMLDVSRLEEGEVLLQRSMVELQEIMEAMQDQVMPRAKAKEMEFVVEPLPELPPLWLDGSMIRRVLINLIDNALKYTPSQGRVVVSTAMAEEKICIAVTDNGPGISKADQGHIFNKFARVDYSSGAPTGVGLGLAFCKLAAEAHGGTVSVESEGISGQGCTFYLSLPMRTEEEDDEE